MSEVVKTCPLCSKELELKQINFTTAIYICPDSECVYPTNSKCIEVERKLEDMNKKPINPVLNSPEMKHWLEENAEKATATTSNAESQGNLNKPGDENSQEMNDWFKELLENPPNNQQTNEESCKELDDLLDFLNSPPENAD